jgi:hypothetical protein
MQNVLRDTVGTLEFRHDNGELSQVHTEKAGMGMRIRIANLQPEVPDRTIRDISTKYGDVKDIKEERRTRAYRYKVSNGIRLVEMSFKQHLPYQMATAGHRVLVS